MAEFKSRQRQGGRNDDFTPDVNEQNTGPQPNFRSTDYTPGQRKTGAGGSVNSTLGSIDDVLGDQGGAAPYATGAPGTRPGMPQADARAARNRRIGVANRQAARLDRGSRSASTFSGDNAADSLAEREKSAGSDGRDEPQAENANKGFYNPTQEHDATRNALSDKEADASGMNYTGQKAGSNDSSKLEGKGKWKKPTGIAGLIIGLLFGGGVGVTFLSGPAHWIQISQTLKRPSALGNHNASRSWGRLLRYAGFIESGDIARTRLSQRGYNSYKDTIAALKKNGVTFTKGKAGIPTRTDVDINKLKAKYPELARMDETARKQFIADKLDISVDEIKGSGASFWVDHGDNYTVSEARTLAGNTIANLGDGKGLFGMKAFNVFKAWRLPLWVFHPMDAAIARAERSALINGRSPTEAEKAAQDAEDARVTAAEAPLTAEGAAAVDDIKASSAKFNSIGMKALLFTGGVCMVREIADKIITVNRAQVALPAAEVATRFIAEGEQVEYGGPDASFEQQGIDMKAIGAAGESAQAYEALTDGTYHTGDPDIPADLQQAFSVDTTAGNIRKFASIALGGDTTAAALCSPVGLGVQMAGGIFLAVSSVVEEAGSLGTLTPVVVGQWAAKEGVSFAVSAVATHFLEKFFIGKNATKLEIAALKSAALMNVAAYGAREMANITGEGTGGVDIGNKNSTYGLAQEQQTEMQQFRSQSFFARMFAPYNSHSLFGHFLLDISPSFSQNMMSVTSSIMNVGNILPNLVSGFTPKASALASNYPWTFGQVGVPDSIENDPNLQNPYDNGNKVASIFNSACTGDIASCSYAKRIMSCFGNTLSYSDGMWDVQPTNEVNDRSDDYLNANCNKIGTAADTVAGNDIGIWRRIIRYVSDNSTMTEGSCYLGNDEDCPDANTTSPTLATDPKNVDQSTMYLDSSSVPCAAGTKDIGVYDGYHNGQKIPVRLCALPNVPSSSEESHDGYGVTGAGGKAIVNARVSANYLALATNAASAGHPLTATSSFRSMAHQTALCKADSGCRNGNYNLVAKPGTSNHQMGLAIDFSIKAVTASTSSCVGRAEAPGDPMWNWLNDNAGKYGIHQYANESWHWETSIKATDCGGDGSK